MQVNSAQLTRDQIAPVSAALEATWSGTGPVELDLQQVTEIDSAGAAWIAQLRRRADHEGRSLHLRNASPDVARMLDLMPFVREAPERPRVAGLVESVGERAAELREALLEYLLLCADLAWYGVRGILRPREIRWPIVNFEMAAMGSQALGVVGLIAFLIGGTIALQSAAQLRQFGANIFVADLIGVSLTRELGPLITAIVVAGRSGSAVAAELGTMVVSEEIDALRTMGLNPVRFLVLPKFIAITITQPLLTVLADLLGILGGFLVAIIYLGVGPEAFVERLLGSLQLKDLLVGLFKAVVFAQLIVTIGAVVGLRTRGGADAVGRSATLSVVASIFAVIVADAVASLTFYFSF
ncbi:MAG: MlaE family lipid ABC transporter permease subunit [Pseudomonadota bacterium]